MVRVLKYLGVAIGGLIALFAIFILMAQTGFFPVFASDYGDRSLTVTDCSGSTKGKLEVGVADTFSKSYVGLSRQETLEPNRGLLFPYDEPKTPRIEMRNLDFGLDVLFVGPEGKIGTIETLPAPDSLLEYYFTYDSTYADGQYVIEVNEGWASAHGVTEGDCVQGLPAEG